MSKLTKLEMNLLQNIADDVEAIQNSYESKQDDIQDFLHGQFAVTDPEESGALSNCIIHFEFTTDKLRLIQDQMALVVGHFIKNRD